MRACYPGHGHFSPFGVRSLNKPVFLVCRLPTYRFVAMLSMPIPSKRAAERNSTTLIITLPLDLKVGVYLVGVASQLAGSNVH